MDGIGIFTVVKTGDGSPSLKGELEPMHHLGGAYSETQYIYGEALRGLLQWPDLATWKVLVVGLGLGYIELLAMAEALKNDRKLQLLSYEISDDLVREFLRWLRQDSSQDPSIKDIYDQLHQHFQKDYPNLNIREALLQAHNEGSWQIKGALDHESLPGSSYQALLFDAFSGKATPSLWTEEFLALFLLDTAQVRAIFSTYACTGVLRRSLANAGFQVEKRPGFQGKRHSTIAIKGMPQSSGPQ